MSPTPENLTPKQYQEYTRPCQMCGAVFTARTGPSRKKRKYCSEECCNLSKSQASAGCTVDRTQEGTRTSLETAEKLVAVLKDSPIGPAIAQAICAMKPVKQNRGARSHA